MKAKRIKSLVLPILYVTIIAVSFIAIAQLNNLLTTKPEDYKYSESLLKNETMTVEGEQPELKIVKPFTSDKVSVRTAYYNRNDENEKQEKALIYYQNTYMPSTGIIYTADESFDVVATLDGEVKSVKTDALLGTVVEISHNSNLTTFYYSLKNVTLKAGEYVTTGTKIGNSSNNKLIDNPSLLFEVYYQGKSMDPEKFYEALPKDLQ